MYTESAIYHNYYSQFLALKHNYRPYHCTRTVLGYRVRAYCKKLKDVT
jgi:hypothetical protein